MDTILKALRSVEASRMGIALCYGTLENFRIFNPNPQHETELLHALPDQIVAWGGALKALHQQEAEEAAMP